MYTAEKSGQVWFCGCKATAKQPFCDGTHNKL
jgi:CDGSH-type Zn-finger protein